jgi:hypothetical protein
MRLQQQQLLLRTKLDRAYDDRLSSRISDELWSSKSTELEAELQRVRVEMARHERASHEYEATGLQILELAQSASLYRYAESAGTGSIDENAAIELHVRSRRSRLCSQ